MIIPPAAYRKGDNCVSEPCILDALRFLVTLEEVDPRLSTRVSIVDLTGTRFARVYMDTLDVALLYEPSADWSGHVFTLPAVIADMSREGLSGSVIDMRFQEQVVRRGGDKRSLYARQG